jgi:hypothetical protein
MRKPMRERDEEADERSDTQADGRPHAARVEDGGAPEPAPVPTPDATAEPRRRTLVPERPLTERSRGAGSLDWVHQFRVSPLALAIFLGALAGLWALFEFTDLWYVLFP